VPRSLSAGGLISETEAAVDTRERRQAVGAGVGESIPQPRRPRARSDVVARSGPGQQHARPAQRRARRRRARHARRRPRRTGQPSAARKRRLELAYRPGRGQVPSESRGGWIDLGHQPRPCSVNAPAACCQPVRQVRPPRRSGAQLVERDRQRYAAGNLCDSSVGQSQPHSRSELDGVFTSTRHRWPLACAATAATKSTGQPNGQSTPARSPSPRSSSNARSRASSSGRMGLSTTA
jgi:hypothetical protein